MTRETSLTPVTDLQPGDLIDLDPLIDRLVEEGHMSTAEAFDVRAGDIELYEYAEVEEVRLESGGIAVIYTHTENLAVPAHWEAEALPAQM